VHKKHKKSSDCWSLVAGVVEKLTLFDVTTGLKPGQRKVLYTCLRRNDKREVKVAQLAGSVAELSAYHHGEVSFDKAVAVAILFMGMEIRRLRCG